MKEINSEMFGLLYDKLYEHLTKTEGNIKSVGIEPGETNKTLAEMWKSGKTWETIALIIAFHYSRKDSILIQLQDSRLLISRGASFTEIQKLLGIKKMKFEITTIKRNDFDEEFSNLWAMFRGRDNIRQMLKGLGIEKEDSLLENYWEHGYKWETVSTVIISRKIKIYGDINVETEYGIYNFKNQMNCEKIIEIIQNAPTKP